MLCQVLENKAMHGDMLEKLDQFFNHIRRLIDSLTTHVVFKLCTTHGCDPGLKQFCRVSFFQLDSRMMLTESEGFDKFCKAIGSRRATLVDPFPILRNLFHFKFSLQGLQRNRTRRRQSYISVTSSMSNKESSKKRLPNHVYIWT
jgi:hypothetical protein